MIQAERDNLDLAESIIKAEGLDVDFWRGELCEVHLTEAKTQKSKRNYEAWLEARRRYGLPDDSHGTVLVTDQDDARKVCLPRLWFPTPLLVSLVSARLTLRPPADLARQGRDVLPAATCRLGPLVRRCRPPLRPLESHP